ncbi:MAG: SRPBCC family protein [Marinilabiliales bacterium]|nr:SRPBCC family protein [Marinilabiliales bacterium]
MLQITRMNGISCLKHQQVLPVSPEEAWQFFATPANLNEMTPAWLTFEIRSVLPEKMYEGLMIQYRIRPFLRLPMGWLTEITHVRDGEYFVDEQRKGPYRLWHHEHHFEPCPEGVRMTDLLYYDIGYSFLGVLAGKLFVHRMVREIFAYRQSVLEARFNQSAVG